MKAAVFKGPENMETKEVERPEIGEGEILLKVFNSAICGTDVRIYTGKKTKDVRTPSIIGHETVGEIVDIGTNVVNYKVGERVGIIPIIYCQHCDACLNGLENACENRQAIGYEFDGGFAEYVKIPKKAVEKGNLLKIPDHVTYSQAVITEPLACCINGLRKSNVQLNDTVLVIGAGPIGLMHVQLSKIAGAGKVYVSEIVDHRREKALQAGADEVINPEQESLQDKVKEFTEGKGADVCVMAIGVGALVNECAGVLKKCGTLNLFAGFSKGEWSQVDPNLIHYNELHVVGTTASTRADNRNALSLIANNKVDTEVLTTSGYSLNTIEEAITDVMYGTGMKSVLTINE
ncbi:zinc-dependent dehydrogenase [Salibacterium halotolerans]|uniref:L-iditol 2-dehydrogenase n=1 Tax=Salibacterium halotolerans TaxID=1884432 RepID=A0A1I5LAS5_9BACI|nr:zinc-dependent dehydrogenase [Salibacterium halotolerans]SFO94262.1 L-iditol 2-dehydrogenase [Salibacterium halotolerans]